MKKPIKKTFLASAGAALFAVATVASVSMLAAPAWAANNDVAPTIDYPLPYTKDYSYVSESLAVAGDGSYWLCAEESAAPFGAYAFKFAAGSSGVDIPIQMLNLNNDQGGCTDLAVDSQGNLYAAIAIEIDVYAPGSYGVIAPIRTIEHVSGDLNTGTMSFDAQDRLYVFCGDGLCVYSAGATGVAQPERVIDDGDLGSSDLYVAADADGVVYVADYDEDKVRVFGATNDGPTWDREFWLDDSIDAGSFGGLAVNGDKVFVTFQDGTAPGVYVFAADSDGAVVPDESWSGSNVVVSSNDALYDVGVGGCSGELVTFEGYNDRILTWDNLTTECTNPAPSPSPELPSTGADLVSATGLGLSAAALALIGGALVLRRRVRFHG